MLNENASTITGIIADVAFEYSIKNYNFNKHGRNFEVNKLIQIVMSINDFRIAIRPGRLIFEKLSFSAFPLEFIVGTL